VRAEAAGSLALFADSFDYSPAGQAIEQRIRDTLLSYAAQPGEPETVRAMALESGSLFGDSEQLQRLIDAFYAEDETGLRLSALIAMGNSAAERWSAVLTSELFSDDNELRRAAATALGQIGNPDALPDLLKATRDTDLDARHAAILAIGEIPGPASRRILNTLAADPLPEDARVIQEALAEERLFSLEPEDILDPDELPEFDPDDEDLM
jgi:HEAT repeat protein